MSMVTAGAALCIPGNHENKLVRALDGVSVGSVAGDLATPSPYSRLYLWNQPSAGTVWFDDVKVADAQSGPVGAGAAGLPGPQVALSPTTLTFGSQTTQTTSAPQTVTLTNTGGSPADP